MAMSRGTRIKARPRQGDPKPSRRQETLKVTSERVQEAHRRAQQCFLSMIEGPVEPQVFVAKVQYINPQVYSDVVVERAVAGLCGYPMCCNTFTDTYGSRTYIIRSNKLYDISERRNFCSNVCYEASELVRKQVLTLPLYLRDTEDADIRDLHLPNLTMLKGYHGKLIDITGGINKIDLDEDKPSRMTTFKSVDDIARESLVNWSEHNVEENTSDNNTHESNCDADEKESCNQESKDDSRNKIIVDPLADVLRVESVMRHWVSFDSLRLILGDLYVRGMLEHFGHSREHFDTTSGLRLSVEAKARCIAICRRLEHDEREEEDEQDTLDQHPRQETDPSKPLPDYSQLQHDAKKLQLKVVSFFEGNDHYEEAGEKLNTIPEGIEEECQPSTKRKAELKKTSENFDTREPTLPFVDSYSQAAWRQNIVLEKVTTYLQQMLEMMKLSVHEIRKLLVPLVATFHFSPDNISFQPKQWRLITLILLKLLSVRYSTIQDALRSEEGLNMQRTILSTYSLDLGYTDRLLSYLTEIQHVLSKDFKDEKNEAAEKKNTPENSDVPLQAYPGRDLEVDRVRESVNSTETQRHSQDMT